MKVKRGVSSKGFFIVLKCQAVIDTGFVGLNGFPGGYLFQEAADRNEYVVLLHEPNCTFGIVCKRPKAAYQPFFDKAYVFGDGTFLQKDRIFSCGGTAKVVFKEFAEAGFQRTDGVEETEDLFHMDEVYGRKIKRKIVS